MRERSDFATYVDARWPDLVGGLLDEGVPEDRARLAVAQALLAARRSWVRRTREEQVDVTLWAEVRERVGLPVRPGEPVPHAVRRLEPRNAGDGPDEWLHRAARVRAGRRRRAALRAVVGLAAVALLAAGWAWWAARPDPPAVRREANRVPVAWYAAGELHLQDVVVELPDVADFVADEGPAAVVARLRSGEVVRVDADGDVEPVDEAPDALEAVPAAPPLRGIGADDVVVDSVPLPDGGGWAHLVDSAKRVGAQDELRQSETGRRAVVVCPTEWTCEEPVTIAADGPVRLR